MGVLFLVTAVACEVQRHVFVCPVTESELLFRFIANMLISRQWRMNRGEEKEPQIMRHIFLFP